MISIPPLTTPSTPASRLLMAIGALTCVEFFETGLVMFSASQIMTGLDLSPEAFAFAFTLYGVGSIFMLFKHQWMVERLGYRDFALASLAVFVLGAILCAAATGLAQFALGRTLQGLGGATFFTAGRMQINRLPGARRFRGQLIFIGSLLLASAIAPVASTALVGVGGWRAVFWCALPLTTGVAWIVHPCLSRELTPPAERSQEHWGWLLWMALGVFGLQYTIQELPSQVSADGKQTVLLGATSALVLIIFAWRQWRQERPLINYRGLFQRRYLLGLGLYFSGYFMAGVSGFVLPVFFQKGLGWSLASTATMVTLGLCASVLSALAHAALARRWPQPRPFMFCALLLYAAGNLILSQFGSRADWSDALLPVLMCGVAIPLFLGPVAFGTFSELPPKVFSHGYQVKNIVRQLGLSSSIAVATVALQLPYAGQAAASAAAPGAVWEQVWQSAPIISALASHLSNPPATASSSVFLALALLMIPLALILRLQRVFR